MLHDKDRLFDKDGRSFIVTHNLKGNTIKSWEKQFLENETHRLVHRKDSVKFTHEILSWSREDADKISLQKLEDMTRRYLELRNPNGMYLAVPHTDKAHYHCHIIASGVAYRTGKSLHPSRPVLQKLKKEIQEYQIEKYPELEKSVVSHGKRDVSRLTEKEYQYKLRTGRVTDREQVIGMLKSSYRKAESKETFIELLKESGLKTYDRSGKTTGIIFNDRKFRFSRLGFTEERLMELEQFGIRKSEIRKVREKEQNLPKKRTLARGKSDALDRGDIS
jgi:Relaxase/Mobilisation nuclease domain